MFRHVSRPRAKPRYPSITLPTLAGSWAEKLGLLHTIFIMSRAARNTRRNISFPTNDCRLCVATLSIDRSIDRSIHLSMLYANKYLAVNTRDRCIHLYLYDASLFDPFPFMERNVFIFRSSWSIRWCASVLRVDRRNLSPPCQHLQSGRRDDCFRWFITRLAYESSNFSNDFLIILLLGLSKILQILFPNDPFQTLEFFDIHVTLRS